MGWAWRAAVLAAVVCPLACHESLAIDGVSLECQSDRSCVAFGSDWRCIEGLCVRNTPPSLAPFATVFVTLGDEVVIAAHASDLEGDDLIVTWEQLEGPSPLLLDAPTAGESLEVQPAQVGLYRFEARVHDGFSEGDAQPLQIVVQPSEPGAYVSDLGADADGCGSVLAPCASIARGLQVVRESADPSQPVYLAAAQRTTAYRECVRLSNEESLRGCFDPITWAPDPSLRAACRIECGEATGHHLDANASAATLTFALTAAVPPLANERTPEPDDALPVITLQLGAGQPMLADATVELGTCASSCDVLGLATIYSDAVVTGVDVEGAAESAHVDQLIGVLTFGGAPAFTSVPLRVTLPHATGAAATGIFSIVSRADFTGSEIAARGQARITGARVVDGRSSLTGVSIELRGARGGAVSGVSVDTCARAPDARPPCDCARWSTWCPEPGAEPDRPEPAQASITAASIAVDSASAAWGRGTCSAVGLSSAADGIGLTATDNDLAIGEGFPLAVGALIRARDLPAGTQAWSLADNRVSIGASSSDPVCREENGSGADYDVLVDAHLGVAVVGPVSPDLAHNRIAVGAHPALSVGLAVLDTGRARIAGNIVDVATNAGPRSASTAFGVLVKDSAAAADEPSELLRNQVTIGFGYAASTALRLAGSPYWSVVNNILAGGPSAHAVGVELAPTELAPDFPSLAHNTIFAGGEASAGGSSTAVAMRLDDGDPLTDGTGADDGGRFVNNLLDVGAARGRRQLFANEGAGFFASGEANVGQFFADDTHVGLSRVIAAPRRPAADGSPAATISHWMMLLEESGELWSVAHTPGTLTPVDGVMVPGRTLAAWMGPVGGATWIAVALEDGVAVGPIIDEQPPRLAVHPARGGPVTEWPHEPYAITAGFWGERSTASVAFLDEDGHGSTRLWVMRGEPDGGLEPPTLEMELPRRALLDTHTGSRSLIVAEGPVLHLYPSGHVIDLTDILGAETEPNLLFVCSVDDPGGPGVEDVLLVDDTRASLWLNPDLSDDGSNWASGAAFGERPCGPVEWLPYGADFDTSVVTAVAVGKLTNLSAWNELAFGCADGRVDPFWYNGGLVRLSVPDDRDGQLSGIPVTSVAMGYTRSGPQVVATYGSIGEVQTYLFSLALPPNMLAASHLTIANDVAWRDPASGLWAEDFGGMASEPGVTLGAPGNATPCPFVQRVAEPGAPLDLHLAGDGANACVDGGVDAGQPDDVDGCGARPDPFDPVDPPDIGADEAGAEGQECVP